MGALVRAGRFAGRPEVTRMRRITSRGINVAKRSSNSKGSSWIAQVPSDEGRDPDAASKVGVAQR